MFLKSDLKIIASGKNADSSELGEVEVGSELVTHASEARRQFLFLVNRTRRVLFHAIRRDNPFEDDLKYIHLKISFLEYLKIGLHEVLIWWDGLQDIEFRKSSS